MSIQHFFYFSFLIAAIIGCQGAKAQNVLDSLKADKIAELAADSKGYIRHIGDEAPDFFANLTTGDSLHLRDLRGKIVVLQFTASWCGVCRKEMPELEMRLWQKYKDQNFVLIGIDRDEPLEKVLSFINQTGITYPMALDPGAEIFSLFAHKEAGVTRNVVIDKEGKIAYLTRLYNEIEFTNMIAVIEALISQK